MSKNGDNGETLADKLGISRTTLSAKMNKTGGAEFKQCEMHKIKSLYNLGAEDIDRIFFNNKVS